MRWFDGPHQGIMALVYLIATAKGADTGAYALGRIAGRHKLWPSLSPKKTVEGAVGGLILSVMFALVVAAIARYLVEDSHVRLAPGRRFWAARRRRRPARRLDGVDDQARLRAQGRLRRVPGFGGVLDVIDSLIFAGPVAYAFWLFIGP